jgi:hypothetical protein
MAPAPAASPPARESDRAPARRQRGRRAASGTRWLRAVPAWLWLGLIVLASFAYRTALASDMAAPFIMVDELIYAELARSFADGGELLVRGAPASGYGAVYPVLLSPVYALSDSLVTAYAAVKALNSLVMSAAAVPAYLLARRMLPVAYSLLAAVLVVSVPSMVYTATVMTENVFYPVFLLACWALVLVLERPTAWRTALLGLLLVLALATRVQALALVPALLVSPLLLTWFERRPWGEGVRHYRRLYGATLLLGAAVLALQVARGRSFSDFLGAYAVVGESGYEPGTVARYAAWHLEELTLYLGVLPVACSIVLVGLVRRQPRTVQAFVAAAIPVTAAMTLAVAAFASEFIAGRIQERNLFPVAAFFLIAMVVWVYRGAPRPPALAVPAIVLAVGLPLLFPFSRFIDTGAISDTLALLPIWSLYGKLLFDSVDWTVLAGGVAAGLLFLLVPRRFALAVPLVVLAWFAVVSKPIWNGAYGVAGVRGGAGALYQGIRAEHRDWIDRALPGGAEVAVVWTGSPDRFVVNQNEFFNRSVGPVYFTDAPTPGNLAETKLDFDRRSGTVRFPDGRPFAPEYVLVDGSIDPAGEVLARDSERGMTLWRLRGPLESVSRVTGVGPDTWSGPRVTYTRRRCTGGSVAVGISGDSSLFGRTPQTIVARAGGRVVGRLRIDPGQPRTVLRAPLLPRDGVCRVVYSVTPTAVPDDVLGNGDRRELGAHFDGWTFGG